MYEVVSPTFEPRIKCERASYDTLGVLMSWESVEEWPGEGQPQGALFRGTTEPVVATREDLSFERRARLRRETFLWGVPIREGTSAPQSATPALDEKPFPQNSSQMRAWRVFVFPTSLSGALFFSKVLWIVNASVRMGTFGMSTRIGLFVLKLLLGWAFGQRLCQRIGGSVWGAPRARHAAGQ